MNSGGDRPLSTCERVRPESAEEWDDLLSRLARSLGLARGDLCLLDSQRRRIWPEPLAGTAGRRAGDDALRGEGEAGAAAGAATEAAVLAEIPLEGYGILQVHAGAPALPGAAQGRPDSRTEAGPRTLPPPLPPAWNAAFADLVVSRFESETELGQLVDEHIATTNQLLALYKIINRTRDTWELPAKMEAVLEEAARQSGAGQAVLMLADPRWPLCIRRGPSGAAQERARALAEGLHGTDTARIDSAGASVAAPILSRGGASGWLVITEPPGGSYKAKDLKLVQALSELAGGFLSTANLQEQVIANLRLAQEVEIASRIQALLLSEDLPECPGLAVHAACRPAFQVGGDFYAATRHPGGDFVFAFGDVAGKGVPAALFMAMTRTVLMTLSRLHTDPLAILQEVNRVLSDDLEKAGKFVTLVVGRYRPADGRIDLANAGHSPVLALLHPGADPVVLAPHLPPIGVLQELSGKVDSFQLAEGGLLAVMSDGLSEARSPAGELFGNARLQAMLRDGAGGGVRKLEESIFSRVEAYSAGAPRADDQTMLLLQRRAV